MPEAERLRALLAALSHDFRTPLGTIIGAATGLLAEDACQTPETRRRMLSAILDAAQRLERYTRNALDAAAVAGGRVAARLDWVDVEDVVGTALEAAGPALAGHSVTVWVEPGLPLLFADFVLVERALVNLLENAARHSAPDSRIEIQAGLEGDRVCISVFNTGSDISAEAWPRLFEPFYRAGGQSGGAGLGLAICRGFMAAHGGEVAAARDTARGGVTFTLRFPVADAPEADPEAEE